MNLYGFTDYDALFDLIEYTKIRVSLFFKLIREYGLKNIDDLYHVCKKKLPKRDGVITSNIDSHIGRALDLLIYPKGEIILPVARFYANKIKEYLLEKGVVNDIVLTKGLVRGEPTLDTIDILVSTSSIYKLKEAISSFYLFKRYEKEDKNCISFRSTRDHVFNIYVANKSYFGNASFYLSFSKKAKDLLERRFSNYEFAYDKIVKDKSEYKFENEESLFKFLDIQFIPHDLRWDSESVEKAISFSIPELIEMKDIKGDLHLHTFFSDGEGYIEDAIQEAKSLKYSYIAITEHSKSQKTGNGISVEDWLLEADLVEMLNKMYKDFFVFIGLEVDILHDGGLDFPYELLKNMDIVLLALHHPEYGKLDPNEKIAYAMRSEIGSILAHPKDRYWGKDFPFVLDLDYLFYNARQYKVALELSSIPDRIGFTAEEIKEGKKKSIRFAINSDAHAPGYLKNVDIGIIRARRGWLTKEDVVNTYSYERLIEENILKREAKIG